MSDSSQSFSIKQSWIAIAAVMASLLAVAGVVQTSSPNRTQGTSTNDSLPSPGGLVSFPQSTWEDPFKQLQSAKAILASSSNQAIQPNVDLNSLQVILADRLAANPTSHRSLLILMTLVPGNMTANEVETRLRNRHAFEIALSTQEFRPFLADRITFVRIPKVETSFSTRHQITTDVELPVKLYQNGKSEMILNIWVNQELMGEKPWKCLDSIAAAIADPTIRARARLAIVGPTSSDFIKKMKPNRKDHRYYFLDQELKNLSAWGTEIFWLSPYGTVPRVELWNELESSGTQSASAIAAAPIGFTVPVDFQVPIVDDTELVSSLADELRSRLGGLSISKRQILLFVEQDRAFGRTLKRLMSEELEDNFEFVTIQYLRGISESNEASGLGTGTSVADYFSRTLSRETESWLYSNAATYKPAAVGILGGSYSDKLALMREIKSRFPQALCFTNDFDARYLDNSSAGVTRNLTIVSHQDPMPRHSVNIADEHYTTISFRDEYQASFFNGFIGLVQQLFPHRRANAVTVATPEVAKPIVFEISHFGALLMPPSATSPDPFSPVLLGVLAFLTIVWSFSFPLVHSDRWQATFASLGALQGTLLQPLARFFRLGPAFLVPLLATAVCLLPLSTKESDANRLLSLFSGVNVIPSILFLSMTIPLLFRRAHKNESKQQGSRDGKVTELRQAIEAAQGLLQPVVEIPISRNPKYMRQALMALAATTFFSGCLAWYWTDDAWLLQMGLLGGVAICVATKDSTHRSILMALLIAILIGALRLYNRDYSMIPARDPWIRALGSCIFAISYWWLQIGLFKLIIYLVRLSETLRIAADHVWQCTSDRTPMTAERAEALSEVIFKAGDASRIILRDLQIVLCIGLVVCLARLPVFDAWGMSSTTWLTIISPMAIPFTIAVLLRRHAWQLRDNVLQYMLRMPVRVDNSVDVMKDQKLVEQKAASVKSFDKGAFCPLDRDPLVGAGLALLGAVVSGTNNDIFRSLLAAVIPG